MFGKVLTTTSHEGGRVIDQLSSTGTQAKAVAAEALGTVLSTGDLVTSSSAALGALLNRVVLRGVKQGREQSTVGALGHNTVRGPLRWQADLGRYDVGIVVPVDGVGSTADLVGVASTRHVAFTGELGILDILESSAVALVAVLETSYAEPV